MVGAQERRNDGRTVMRNSDGAAVGISGSEIDESAIGRPAIDLATVIGSHHLAVAGKGEVCPGILSRTCQHLKCGDLSLKR